MGVSGRSRGYVKQTLWTHRPDPDVASLGVHKEVRRSDLKVRGDVDVAIDVEVRRWVRRPDADVRRIRTYTIADAHLRSTHSSRSHERVRSRRAHIRDIVRGDARRK